MYNSKTEEFLGSVLHDFTATRGQYKVTEEKIFQMGFENL